MTKITFAVAVAALVAFGTISLRAADDAGAKKGGFSRTVPYTMEQIAERLGDELKLTDAQKTKVEAINTEFAAKMAEANKKPEVAAAQEAIKKAQESGDRQGMRELYTKLTEVMGFNARDEYKKALSVEGALNEQQLAKLFPQRGPRGGGDKPPAQK